jgi:hypothetical protein
VLDHSGGGVYGRLLSHHSLQTLILSHASRQVAAPTVIAGSPLQPPTSIHLRTLQLPWLVMEFLGGATLLNHLLSAPNLRHLQVGKQRHHPHGMSYHLYIIWHFIPDGVILQCDFQCKCVLSQACSIVPT